MVPMITMLSTGSDPTGKIQDLARKRKNRVRGHLDGPGPGARRARKPRLPQGQGHSPAGHSWRALRCRTATWASRSWASAWSG